MPCPRPRRPGSKRPPGFFSTGDSKGALEALKAAHKDCPDAAQTNAELGALLARLGELREAEPFLARARQLEPKLAALARDYALCLAQLGKRDEALREINEALRLDPNDSQSYLENARLHLNAGKLAEAISVLELLLQRAPAERSGLRLLAHAYRLAGRLEAAAEALQRLIQAAPDEDPAAHEAYLSICLNLGRDKVLIDELRERDRELQSPLSQRMLIKALASFPESFEEAFQLARRASDKKPTDNVLRLEAASLALRAGDLDEARARLAPLLALETPPPQALLLQGLAARVSGQESLAVKAYESLGARAEGRPDLASLAHLGLIALMRENRRYAPAAERIQALSKQSSAEGRADLASLDGLVLSEAGQQLDAFGAFDRAVKGGSTSPETFWRWAMALLAEGRPQDAIATLQEGLRVNPQNQESSDERLRLELWLAISMQLAGAPEAKAALEAIAKTPRRHLPAVAFIAAAAHILGTIDKASFDAACRGHDQGRYFDNDRLFFQGLALETAGQKPAALAVYKDARKASIGDEAPARLIDARIAALSKN